MRLSFLTALLALGGACDVFEPLEPAPEPDSQSPLAKKSSLWITDGSGVALGDDGRVAFLGMAGMTCRYRTWSGAIDLDEDVEVDQPDPVDDATTDAVVLVHPAGITVVHTPADGEDTEALDTDASFGHREHHPFPDARSARFSAQGLVVLHGTAEGCAVTWKDLGVSVAVEPDACTRDADMDVQADGTTWLAYGLVDKVTPAGAVAFGFGDRVTHDPTSGHLLTAGAAGLIAHDAAGERIWSWDAERHYVDVAAIPGQSRFAVLVRGDGLDRIVVVDAVTGDVIGRTELDRWVEFTSLDVSRDGAGLVAWSNAFAAFYKTLD